MLLERQRIIHYEYEGGALLAGHSSTKCPCYAEACFDVKIDRADITLGWRAIINKEIHLNKADVE